MPTAGSIPMLARSLLWGYESPLFFDPRKPLISIQESFADCILLRSRGQGLLYSLRNCAPPGRIELGQNRPKAVSK